MNIAVWEALNFTRRIGKINTAGPFTRTSRRSSKPIAGATSSCKKACGRDTGTGEESTARLLDAGGGVTAYPIEFCARFSVGHPVFPTVPAGVFSHVVFDSAGQKYRSGLERDSQHDYAREVCRAAARIAVGDLPSR